LTAFFLRPGCAAHLWIPSPTATVVTRPLAGPRGPAILRLWALRFPGRGTFLGTKHWDQGPWGQHKPSKEPIALTQGPVLWHNGFTGTARQERWTQCGCWGWPPQPPLITVWRGKLAPLRQAPNGPFFLSRHLREYKFWRTWQGWSAAWTGTQEEDQALAQWRDWNDLIWIPSPSEQEQVLQDWQRTQVDPTILGCLAARVWHF
jgi:hypothetical protein